MVQQIIVSLVIALVITLVIAIIWYVKRTPKGWRERILKPFASYEHVQQMAFDSINEEKSLIHEMFGSLEEVKDKVTSFDLDTILATSTEFIEQIHRMNNSYIKDKKAYYKARKAALDCYYKMLLFKEVIYLTDKKDRDGEVKYRGLSKAHVLIIALGITAGLFYWSVADAKPELKDGYRWETNVFEVNGCQLWYLKHYNYSTLLETLVMHSPQCQNVKAHTPVKTTVP